MARSRFSTTAEELVADMFARKSYYWTIVVVGFMFVAIAGLWFVLPSHVPLYYSRPWGEVRLAPKGFLFLLPTLGLTVSIVNVVLSQFLKSHDVFIVKVLAASALVVTLCFAFSLFGILWSIL